MADQEITAGKSKKNTMKVAAIIVLYNPDNNFLENVKAMITQVDSIVIVNNACDPSIISKLVHNSIHIIDNGANLGLAKALNIGIGYVLKDESYEGVVLFDQDSKPGNDCILNLKKGYQDLTEGGVNVAAVGCLIDDLKDQKRLSNAQGLIEKNVIITSGTLIPIVALKVIGGMDELLFIDYIDYEWCFRALSKGYKIYINQKSILVHNMGDKFISLFGYQRPLHENSQRHYYIIRNQLIMLHRRYIPIWWRLSQVFKLFYRIPAYIFLSSNKAETFSKITKAVKDYKTLNKTLVLRKLL